MTLAAFLHGYPPFWSMGGEVSTHRTLREIPDTTVFTDTAADYEYEGVSVRGLSGHMFTDIMESVKLVKANAVFAHSTLSQATVRAARKLDIPSVLAVHAPPRYATDLRRAWSSATMRVYNTEVSRKEWNDPKGLLLHPPIGDPVKVPNGPRDALTLTSSLLNKGAVQTLQLARKWRNHRFIIVESPAHGTHGSLDFWEEAAALPNVEIWPRLHPDDMGKLWAHTRILLVPSRYETYGLSAIEAAGHGIPSVHIDTPHVREGIGTAARLIRTQRVDELDAAVTEVEMEFKYWSDAAFARAESLGEREKRELAAFTASVTRLMNP